MTIISTLMYLEMLNRYHFFFVPHVQQSYQFLQIAIGMVIDLGLDQKPWNARLPGLLRTGNDSLHYDSDNEDVSSHDFFSRQARRCYLGCYYLSIA